MQSIAKLILVATAVLLLGADGPGDAKPADNPAKDVKDATITREQAFRDLDGPLLQIRLAAPGSGVVVRIASTQWGKDKEGLALLPLFSDAVELSLEVRTATDADLAVLETFKDSQDSTTK